MTGVTSPKKWRQIHDVQGDQLSKIDEIINKYNAVIDKDTLSPPGSPTLGDRYLIRGTGSGDWSGKDNNIAEWGTRNLIDQWLYAVPFKGMLSYVNDEDKLYFYNGSAWINIDTYIAWKPVVLESTSDSSKFFVPAISMQINLPTPGSYDVSGVLPLETNKRGLALFIKTLKVYLSDADGNDFIDFARVNLIDDSTDLGTTILNDPANKTAPGLYTWDLADYDCSGGIEVRVAFKLFITTSADFQLRYIAVEYYYA